MRAPSGDDNDGQPGFTMRRAIMQVALADLSMSLDNVLAVAGAAMDHVWVLTIGLLLSIALMGIAAAMIAEPAAAVSLDQLCGFDHRAVCRGAHGLAWRHGNLSCARRRHARQSTGRHHGLVLSA